MKRRIRSYEFGALALTLLAVATLIRRDWIETVLGVDPDGGSGAAEWGLVIAPGLLAVVLLILARLEYRRTNTLAADS
jgi:hypothetical protein